MEQAPLFADPLAYSGHVLDVTSKTDSLLADLFPSIDRSGEYRLADAWLLSVGKSRWPKKRQAFLLNWFKKTANADRRTEEQREELRRMLNIGAGPVLAQNNS